MRWAKELISFVKVNRRIHRKFISTSIGNENANKTCRLGLLGFFEEQADEYGSVKLVQLSM